MFGKRFEEESILVENALENEAGERRLREFIKPLVVSVANKYKKTDMDSNKGEIEKAGWKYFSQALKNYKKRKDLMVEGKNEVFYFETYITWYIRQGIVEYINSLKNK